MVAKNLSNQAEDFLADLGGYATRANEHKERLIQSVFNFWFCRFHKLLIRRTAGGKHRRRTRHGDGRSADAGGGQLVGGVPCVFVIRFRIDITLGALILGV